MEAIPGPSEEWQKPPVPAMTVKPSGNLKVLMGFALTVLLIFAGYYAYQLQLEGPNRWSIEDIAPRQSKRLVPEDKKAMMAGLKAKNKSKPDQRSDTVEATKGNGLNDLVLSTLKKLNDQLTKFKSREDHTPLPDGKIVLYFELNSNELPEQEAAKLDRVIGFYSEHPDSQIVIDGYTDSRGDPAYNNRLSKFKADMIKSYFAERGIPEAQIKTFGRGPQNPIGDNDTAEGRKKNRRVEIKVNVKE